MACASSRSLTLTIANPPMTSFDSMNGPSVTMRLPFCPCTVVTPLPDSCRPPSILPALVYSSNHLPAAAMAVPYCSFDRLSQRSWSSRVPTNSNRYFMSYLLGHTTNEDAGNRQPRGRPLGAVLGVVDDGPDLHGARPLPGHRQRLVEVGHLDQGKAADDLLGFDEWSVGDDDLAVPARDGGRGAGSLELFAPHNLARPRVLLEPLARFAVVGHRLLPGRAGELVRAFHRAAEQENVFHCQPPSTTTNGARRFRHRLQEPVNSGSCLLRKDMMPMAASVLSAARAKFKDSMSSASSSRRPLPRRIASLIIAMAKVAAFASLPASSSTAC